MGTAPAMMAAAMSVQAASSLGSAYAGSEASKSQADYQRRMSEVNARLAETQAKDTIARGEKAAKNVKKDTRKLIGAQRASLAAQGINVDSGSALEVQAETAGLGAEEELRVRNDAWRTAWGFRAEAIDYRSRGEMAAMAGRREARNTLITGGMSAISSGLQGAYYYKKG